MRRDHVLAVKVQKSAHKKQRLRVGPMHEQVDIQQVDIQQQQGNQQDGEHRCDLECEGNDDNQNGHQQHDMRVGRFPLSGACMTIV